MEVRSNEPTIDLSQPKQPDRSLGELMKEMTAELSTIFRKEVELARLETKEEIGKAGKAAGSLGAAGFTAYLAVLLASFGLAWLLDEWMPTWLGFFLVAAAYGIVAFVMYKKGRERLKAVNPTPEKTVQTLKEDAQWAKQQMS